MARPRNKLFYETPLPDYLPPEKEWLRDYHRNSRNVVEYIARNGVFCKYFLEKIANLFGECCISKLEKIANSPERLNTFNPLEFIP